MSVATRRKIHEQTPSTPKTKVIMPCCGNEHEIAIEIIVEEIGDKQSLSFRHNTNNCRTEVTISKREIDGQQYLLLRTTYAKTQPHTGICLCCGEPNNPNIVGLKKCPHCKAIMNLLFAKDGKSKMIELISVLVPI